MFTTEKDLVTAIFDGKVKIFTGEEAEYESAIDLIYQLDLHGASHVEINGIDRTEELAKVFVSSLEILSDWEWRHGVPALVWNWDELRDEEWS